MRAGGKRVLVGFFIQFDESHHRPLPTKKKKNPAAPYLEI